MSAPGKPSGLSRFFNIPGGISLAEAEARAALKLDTLRGRCEADMQDSLDSLGEYLRLLEGAPSASLRRELHRLSCCVVSLAGTFERGALSKAGYSLCRLLDDMGEGWDRLAVDVHVAAMRRLFTPAGASEEAQQRIVEGLDKVRAQAVRAVRAKHPTEGDKR